MSDLWVLPTTWCWTTMGDATNVIGGGTPSTTNPKSFGGSIPWITPADMSGYTSKTISGGSRCISEQGLEDSGARWLPQGTVLFSSRAPIGYVAIASQPVTTNQGFKSFVPKFGLNSDYVYYWLTSAKVHAEALASGTTFLELSGAKAALIPLPLAPAAEQTRIVEKLEELLSDFDAGVAELKAAQKKLGRYRQSLLKAAVEGALTADWREAQRQHNTPRETGAQLLQRILTERRDRWEAKQLAKFAEQGKNPPKDWQKKYPEPVQPDTSGLQELPEGWVWASLGQLLEGLSSGSRDWAPYYNRGDCIFVMAQNVRPWRADFSFRQYVDPPMGDRDRARSEVRKDDLLVTIVGANTGQACRIHEPLESHFVCQSVALLRLVMTGLSEYVNAVLNSEGHGQRQFREMNYGAGRPHLSFDQLELVCVPLPSVDEQAEIITQVELALDATNEVRAQLDFLRNQSAAQRKNILRAAFSGQLVQQDPNDEPASVLLERIRAERAAHGGEGKQGRRAKGRR